MKRVEYWVYNKLENFNTASEDIDRYYLHNNLEDNAPCFICKELTDICAALEIPVNHDENFVGGEVGICQECAMSLCTEFHTSFPEYKELRDEYRHFLANQDASIKDLVAVTMKAWNDAHEIGKADCPVCSEEYSITFFEDEVRSKIDLPRVGRLCPWCTSQQKKAAPPQVVIQGEIKDSHGKLLNKIKRLIYKDCAVCQSSFAIDLCIKFADLERRHWINPNHIVCASCHFPNSNEYTRGSRLVAINDMEDPNQEKYQLRVYLHNDGTYTTIKKSQEATATTFHGKVSFTDAIIKSLTDGET
jgi:plasmid maintenance system antidote protein VapI